MAKIGNHGRVIPRDAALLHRLYWEENRTSIEIASMFDVTHKSLLRVMVHLGIPRRGVGLSRYQKCIEDGCSEDVFRVLHRTNGSRYGRRCYRHWKEFRAQTVAATYKKIGNYHRGFTCPVCGGKKSDSSPNPLSKCRRCYEAFGREKPETLAKHRESIQPQREEITWIRQSKQLLKQARLALRQRSQNAQP